MTTTVVRPLPHARGIPQQANGLVSVRPCAVALARILSATLSTAYAAPLGARAHNGGNEPEAEGASLWVLYVASAVLVLLGGAFAGLTIALMGQDGIYLQVMARDPSEPQQRNAKRVHDLLNKGKHWVLVTLLLANVIVNETLPVVLDRCLGGGVAAVVGSTFLIVIFGEVLPQSVCVRYGLQIGGYMSKPVLAMMYLLAPIAWPTAKLLDWLLGEDHGTVYKKSGLKTLVTLHKSLGEVSQRLTQDEVTIISAVLDLKDKSVADVMTPMDDVFVMSEDTVLDEETMAMILSAGYSRIPIHETGNPTNFVGMLLVKILITYDPEDCKLVRDFPLATLPETRPETSCLDIVNFFQEGKSHMVLVSEYPGEDHGALGVVTLEDVIEELIGEEIIDESDVYIDVHKAIRRLTPAPKARVQRRQSDDPSGKFNGQRIRRSDSESVLEDLHQAVQTASTTSYGSPMLSSSPKTATLMLRRSSAGLDGQMLKATVPVRANIEDIKQHLKHLGPSNPATNPNKTRSTTVKIKPGSGTHSAQRSGASAERASEETAMEEGDETTRLLRPELSGKDGIQALVQQNYGSVGPAMPLHLSPRANDVPILVLDSGDQAHKSTQTLDNTKQMTNQTTTAAADTATPKKQSRTSSSGGSASSTPTDNTLVPKRPYVRTGSITENIIESGGVRKVVLEMASSADEEEPQQGKSNGKAPRPSPVEEQEEEDEDEDVFVSPFSSRGEEAGSYAEAAAKGASQEAQRENSNTGSGAGKKKNNRRKKRKGGRS
ncbi:hypothetical protein C8A03DRAFT_29062 [Achaetomium macrosporum]|uniref:DUF21-domain-containing protein n=1 Tax=Achaetomium macrosporum TaxID=79813 RepID=A0AAN7HJX0_9PEZI|nr:hypothetical protein C8A03DRAFT_29062 [Achaetomium macrosporum]